jgi:hypothetical protein
MTGRRSGFIKWLLGEVPCDCGSVAGNCPWRSFPMRTPCPPKPEEDKQMTKIVIPESPPAMTLKQIADRRCAASVLIALGTNNVAPSDFKVVELNDYEVVFLRQHFKAFLAGKDNTP